MIAARALAGEAALTFDHFSLTYRDSIQAVSDVSLTIRKGEFVTLIGPSGCGKSTLLSAAAGLIGPQMATSTGSLKLVADRIGYVFQRDTLLPWRTILENVEVGLEIRGVDRTNRRDIARTYLRSFGLEEFENSYPHALSGGMKQRAALARTLTYDPDVILMDEPFGAVDAQTRILLQDELIKIWEENHKTILFVTHDLPEAIIMAQRTIVLSNRPATIKADVQIDLPRPRDSFALRTDERYLEIYAGLWEQLSNEVLAQMGRGRAS